MIKVVKITQARFKMSGSCGMSLVLTIKFKFRKNASCALIVVPASSSEIKKQTASFGRIHRVDLLLQNRRAAEFRREIRRKNDDFGFAFAHSFVRLRRRLRDINLKAGFGQQFCRLRRVLRRDRAGRGAVFRFFVVASKTVFSVFSADKSERKAELI
jgi:hypothetical protein